MQNTLREKRQNSQNIVRDWLEKSSRHLSPVRKKVRRVDHSDQKENKRPRPSVWSEAGKLTSLLGYYCGVTKGPPNALAVPTH